MALDLLKRSEKGSPLTEAEHDTNFSNIETEVNGKAAAAHQHVPSTDLTAGGTPSAGTFLRGDNTWAAPAGAGDMLAATYDPQAIAADAFDMDNMVEGSTNLILTAAERALIDSALQPNDALEAADIASGAITPRVGAISFAAGGTFLENQTIGIADGNLLEVDGTPLSGEFAVFTAAGINGLSAAEAKAALAISNSDVAGLGTMALEDALDYTPTADLGALAHLDVVTTTEVGAGAVSGSKKWGNVQNEPAPVANVSTVTLADSTDHLTLTDSNTQTVVLNEPTAARNLYILNTTGGAVEIQDDQLSTIYAALDDDHLLLLVYTGTGWDVKADVNTIGGGSSQQLVIDGTAAGSNITAITSAILGTTTYRIVQFDQAMTLDNALGAGTAFALWNTDTIANTVTIEAGAGGQGLFDDGESTVDIPPNGVMTFVVISNAGDEPQFMKRGDHSAVNVRGRPFFGGAVVVGNVSGALDASHIGGRWTTTAAVTIPNTQFGVDENARPAWFWCVLVLGAATHDIDFNSETLDVSAQSWGAGDKLSITVTSATTIEIERTAAADIVTEGPFA